MSAAAPRPALQHRGDPGYPTSDGQPMAETDVHLTLMMDLIQRAEQERDRADQAAAENLRLLREIEELRRRLDGA